MNVLTGERIKLRPVEIEDLDVLYRWENDPANWPHSNHLNPFSRFFLEQYILNSDNNIYTDRQLRLMIVSRQRGEPLGIIDLFDFDACHKRAAVGIIVDPALRNKGYAAEALQLVIEYAKKTLSLKQLYCGIDSENVTSLRVFQKQGFRITGTRESWRLHDRRWVDEHFLQLLFRDQNPT